MLPGVGSLCEPLGEHGVGLAHEGLDRAVELARQPSRRLFPRCLDGQIELLRRRLGVPLALARDDALELLDLPALDVRERHLDSCGGLGLAPLDLLRERLLPSP